MARVPEMTFCAPKRPASPTAAEMKANAGVGTRFSLENKYALVTGGARGLGLAIAKGFLEHGSPKVALFDVDQEQGDAAVDELRTIHPEPSTRIVFKSVDVTDAEALAVAVQETAEDFGAIHVLATFAGIVNSVRAIDYTAETFSRLLDVNTTGTFLAAQAVGKEMINRKTGGSIILTASMAGHIVNYPQTHVAYGTCKAAVHHMARCLAAEWASYGIRVNSLSPGYMDTRLNASEDLTDVLPIWYERTPMGRMGDTNEIVGPVVLLASPAGSFMTGADLKVDGGYTLF
ncbi:NAD(P)-binding protein [Aulographum hederae CBS 113979]|uniref:D-arabinitol 2-dehydrogenase [ribulose-forming] n=1 Tax=Aulographum hederae CBS 113979 TaxID=1176131 RepID=A0A6G1GND8_9PEZI|nr:NAD(P)-binding protein [Aulographum hederae CBS 113979]